MTKNKINNEIYKLEKKNFNLKISHSVILTLLLISTFSLIYTNLDAIADDLYLRFLSTQQEIDARSIERYIVFNSTEIEINISNKNLTTIEVENEVKRINSMINDIYPLYLKFPESITITDDINATCPPDSSGCTYQHKYVYAEAYVGFNEYYFYSTLCHEIGHTFFPRVKDNSFYDPNHQAVFIFGIELQCIKEPERSKILKKNELPYTLMRNYYLSRNITFEWEEIEASK